MASPAINRDPHLSGEQPRNTAFVVRPSATHTHTFILLHDVASNGSMFGHDLLRTGRTSSGKTLDQLFPGVRFVFPTSFRRPSSALDHLRISMWFDVARPSDPSFRPSLQRNGLCSSARQFGALLQGEMRLVPARNIVIGGLGQGCAMSLVVLLSLGFRIGGVIGMSGFLPFWFELQMSTAEDSSSDDDSDDDDDMSYDEESDSDDDGDDDGGHEEHQGGAQLRHGGQDEGSGNDTSPQLDLVVQAQLFERQLLQLPMPNNPTRDKTAYGTPVFLGHGTADQTIPCRLGEEAAMTLESVEYEVDWKCYQGLGHRYLVPREMDDIVDFIRSKVGLQPRSQG